jgi:valyl-tRNA synthetase
VPAPDDLTLADRWILSRHHRLVREVNRLMEAYQYGEAGRQINDFLWGEFCDWYIEISKLRLYADDEAAANTVRYVLVYVLERTLRLLHPFMPFVTEEIWQHLPHADAGEALVVAPWPEPEGEQDEVAEADMALVMDLVRAIRNARAEHDVKAGHRIAAVIAGGDQAELLRQQAPIIAALAHVDPARLQIESTLEEKPERAVALVVGAVECYLPLAGLVDIDAERARLTKELDDVAAQIARLEKLLANEGFLTKAPAHVVDGERTRLADLQERQVRLQARLDELA